MKVPNKIVDLSNHFNRLNRRAYKLFAKFVGRSKDNLTRNLFKLFQFCLYSSITIIIINTLFNRDENGVFNWGQYGDFMGGVLNPILSFVAIMGVLVTIVIQHNELKETRKEFKRSADALDKQSKSLNTQNFESAFFNLLELHSEIVNSQLFTEDTDSKNVVGKKCFNTYYFKFIDNALNIKEVATSIPSEKLIEYSYKTFDKKSKKNLEQYLRNLYSTLRFVEKSDVLNKEYYYEMFKAQLSGFELALIFYDGLFGIDQGSKRLIERSSLLENISTIMLVSPSQDAALYDRKAFGSNSEKVSTLVRSLERNEKVITTRDLGVYFSFGEMLKHIENVNPMKFVVLSQPELCRYIKWEFVPEEKDFKERVQDVVGATRQLKDNWFNDQLKFLNGLDKGIYYFDFTDPHFATGITCYASGFGHSRDEWFSDTLPRLIGEITPNMEKHLNGSKAKVKMASIDLGLDYEKLLEEFDSYCKVMDYLDKKLWNMPTAFNYEENEFYFDKEKYKHRA
ncbi:putative phage abortive infection protein [Vibrio parahaemolyticus]|uniref:putative phage abortive infection protein n=2 Tax=Vibrio parahaemolyticus TaxID=670 RepID=UPI0011201405|nr:putative phage abortive infection protein [Vibrio parahaemolyticus]EGQ8454128.1 hypothetical protein [Vibrio parahaemolyticus]EID4382628.1 hypothetical protein [Vibrio parahaemolyticus]TOE18790.1 hypothetical protein CGJ47_23460 [Vibrio parahaemolyticus]HCG6770737.1 hypothetical protein [Vibrio parahaemolyticus]